MSSTSQSHHFDAIILYGAFKKALKRLNSKIYLSKILAFVTFLFKKKRVDKKMGSDVAI